MRSLCIPGVGAAAPRGQMLAKCLYVLKVACHSLFEILLHVPDVYLVCHLTSDLVDDDRDPTCFSALAFASPSGVSAIAVPNLEIQ
jgi:hypothetical protein